MSGRYHPTLLHLESNNDYIMMKTEIFLAYTHTTAELHVRMYTAIRTGLEGTCISYV